MCTRAAAGGCVVAVWIHIITPQNGWFSLDYIYGVFFQLPTHPDSGPFCAEPRRFSLKYDSIPAEKRLAQHENSSPPVTFPVFRYTLQYAAASQMVLLLFPPVSAMMKKVKNVWKCFYHAAKSFLYPACRLPERSSGFPCACRRYAGCGGNACRRHAAAKRTGGRRACAGITCRRSRCIGRRRAVRSCRAV